MTANVALIAPGDAQAALLPLTSIYQKDGKPAVWRYDPASGQVTLVPVAIGQYREDGVLVTSGVANGDWIVAAGVNKLVPGQVVRPYESGPGLRRAAGARRQGRRAVQEPRRPRLTPLSSAHGAMTSPIPPGGTAGSRFNLSEWALTHRSLVLYLIVVLAVAGRLSRTSGSASPRIRRSRSR